MTYRSPNEKPKKSTDHNPYHYSKEHTSFWNFQFDKQRLKNEEANERERKDREERQRRNASSYSAPSATNAPSYSGSTDYGGSSSYAYSDGITIPRWLKWLAVLSFLYFHRVTFPIAAKAGDVLRWVVDWILARLLDLVKMIYLWLAN